MHSLIGILQGLLMLIVGLCLHLRVIALVYGIGCWILGTIIGFMVGAKIL